MNRANNLTIRMFNLEERLMKVERWIISVIFLVGSDKTAGSNGFHKEGEKLDNAQKSFAQAEKDLHCFFELNNCLIFLYIDSILLYIL